MTFAFDARVTPARPDLAASHLKGKIEAANYADGRKVQTARGIVALRGAPSQDAERKTELLQGEIFTVYESREGWVWGQAARDSYVGYARAEEFANEIVTATHRVAALSTPVLSAPSARSALRGMMPLNATLAIAEWSAPFAKLQDGNYVFGGHLAPLDSLGSEDWVTVAERFLGVPYLWGGKTVAGLDCSGLVQTALHASGLLAPRDSDMMQAELGTVLSFEAPLRRGDLIFWKGHVGVMRDAENLLHANGFRMEVSVERLAEARVRILKSEGLDIVAIKRL